MRSSLNDRLLPNEEILYRSVWLEDRPVDSPILYFLKTENLKFFGNLKEWLYRVQNLLKEINTTTVELTLSEKAFLQRDLLQAYVFLSHSKKILEFDSIELKLLDQILIEISSVIGEIRLSEDALSELKRGFNYGEWGGGEKWNLKDNYLPLSDIINTNGWKIIGNLARAHNFTFRGSSVFRSYIKIPNYSINETIAFIDGVSEIHKQYKGKMGPPPVLPPIPEGSEVALIRTIGLINDKNEYVDTEIVEEVFLRLFKYSKPKRDAQSSDYKGTYYYHYKIDRRKFLSGEEFYMNRRYDCDISFSGFMGEVPDYRHTLYSYVTTTASNCRECHSSQFYGTHSLFSLEKLKIEDSAKEMYYDKKNLINKSPEIMSLIEMMKDRPTGNAKTINTPP